MTNELELRATALAELTADVVAAYVRNNPVPVGELPGLIASIHQSMSGLSQRLAPPAAELVPAVNPKRSVQPDFIICLDDGKKFKSMKRHVAQLGMTPDEYRAKWNLPGDYPMVAPNYSTRRSDMAKTSGLGRKASPVAPAKKEPAKRKATA